MLASNLCSRWALALLIPALAAGCGTARHMQSLDISDHDGRHFVGDIAVDYHQEVSLQGQLAAEGLTLKLMSHTGAIDVVGSPGDSYELVLDLYTEFEGDGMAELDGDGLRAWSDMNGAILINGIRGRLPEGVSLEIQAGTGDVLVTSFFGPGSVDIKNGTGTVSVRSCEVSDVSINSGTGDVRMAQCTVESVRMNMGIGSLAAKDCTLGKLRGDSGTGDFLIHSSRIDHASFVSGVGDVRLTDTLISELHSQLGTGRVEDQKSAANK